MSTALIVIGAAAGALLFGAICYGAIKGNEESAGMQLARLYANDQGVDLGPNPIGRAASAVPLSDFPLPGTNSRLAASRGLASV